MVPNLVLQLLQYFIIYFGVYYIYIYTLQGTSISPQNGIFEDYFPFPHPWRVYNITYISIDSMLSLFFVWISCSSFQALRLLLQQRCLFPMVPREPAQARFADGVTCLSRFWSQISWFDPEIYMIWVYMYIYIFIYLYRERERERD